MKAKACSAIPMAFAALSALDPTPANAVEMFLKIGDIEGESQNSKHMDEIDVLAWSWQLSKASELNQASIRPIKITKKIDTATDDLLVGAINGTVFQAAELNVERDGTQAPYIKIELKDVIVTSINTGATKSETELTETITLDFNYVCYTYTPFDSETGQGGQSDTQCIDLLKLVGK